MDPSNRSQTSSTLLNRVRDVKNKEAWEQFVDLYAPRIDGWCRQQGAQHADAQDVTQEVLVCLIERMATFHYDPEKGRFRSWLKTVTRHAWMDYAKRQNRHPYDWIEDVPDDSLVRALDDVFDLEVLEEAKARVRLQVSDEHWHVFRCLTEEAREPKAVALEFKKTLAAIYMIKSRIQAKLRSEIQGLEGPESEPEEN